MEGPSVSVILPTRDRAPLLGRAVDSVLGQTDTDFELIVVDDASTDDTAAVLAAIDDPRLRVITLAENRGASHARNRGIHAAGGHLLSFIDSDDVWLPEKLARQRAALEAAGDDVGLCVCSMEVHRGGARYPVRYAREMLSGEEAARRLVSGIGVGTPCWLARREAVTGTGGFDESLPRMQDYELALRIAGRWRILLTDDVLVRAEVGEDSLSASADRYAAAITAIVARHQSLFERHRRGHSHMVFRAGKYYALEGRYREARVWFARALRIRRGNARALAGWLLCATGLFAAFRRLKYGR